MRERVVWYPLGKFICAHGQCLWLRRSSHGTKKPSKITELISMFSRGLWMGGLFKKRGEKWKTSVLPGLHSGVPASEAMKALAHTWKTSRHISRIHNNVPLGVIGVEYGIQIMSAYEVFKGHYVYRWKRRGPSTEPCGTPHSKAELFEMQSSRVTHWERPCR